MTQYIIHKSSRYYTTGNGYSGVTCDNANIEPGKIYDSLPEAEGAARKMSKCNPVGFVTAEYSCERKKK